MLLKAKDITIDKLTKGDFKDNLPELYDLSCIENNPWHHNTSVFNHTIEVLNRLEEIFNSWSIDSKYLDWIYDVNSNRDILFIASLFHDISKCDTISFKEWFWTVCPWHEEEWAKKVLKILDKFDLSWKEKNLVSYLVKNHWHIHYILDLDNDNLENDLINYKNKFEKVYYELIIMALSDTLASELYLSDKDNYDFRIKYYWDVLLNFKK